MYWDFIAVQKTLHEKRKKKKIKVSERKPRTPFNICHEQQVNTESENGHNKYNGKSDGQLENK